MLQGGTGVTTLVHKGGEFSIPYKARGISPPDMRCNRSHMKQDYEHSMVYRCLNHLLNLTRVAYMSDQQDLI